MLPVPPCRVLLVSCDIIPKGSARATGEPKSLVFGEESNATIKPTNKHNRAVSIEIFLPNCGKVGSEAHAKIIACKQ